MVTQRLLVGLRGLDALVGFHALVVVSIVLVTLIVPIVRVVLLVEVAVIALRLVVVVVVGARRLPFACASLAGLDGVHVDVGFAAGLEQDADVGGQRLQHGDRSPG